MEQLTPEEMDANAKQALVELVEDGASKELTLADTAQWMKRWYMRAGYKRLGRILIKFAPEGD